MKDHALASLIRTILGMKTKGEAVAHAQNVGADYADLINALIARLTWNRTKSQNALLHVWFGEIARHFGDRSAKQVKGDCHRDIGMTIKLRDDVFEWLWRRTGAGLDAERQSKYLASEAITFSSTMSVKDLSEYMDAIERHYTPKGVRLTERESG